MKSIALYTLLFFSSVLISQNEKLNEAATAFDKKEFQKSANLYEEVMQDGYQSSELFFNAGNAYYRQNKLGKAIYYYELAKKLNPNDEDVKINLSIANGKTLDKIDTRENFLLTAVKTNILQSLSTDQWAWIGILALTVGLVGLFMFFVFDNMRAKKLALVGSALFLVGFIITYILGFSALKAKNNNKFAIILDKEVTIQNEPVQSAAVKFRLHEGTKVRLIKTNGDWSLVSLDNGNEGWLQSKTIGII